MGMLTELFRRMKGVRQSLHPTHRVAALGPLATELTEGHDTAPSTFGPGSPFDFMARRDTLIVGLGTLGISYLAGMALLPPTG